MSTMLEKSYKLVLRDDGVMELEHNGKLDWASDSDEDLVEKLGVISLEGRHIFNVLAYLVTIRKLTQEQASRCEIEAPEDDPIWEEWDDLTDEDEDEDEEEDEDEDEDRDD
jgi:hypothetical protein